MCRANAAITDSAVLDDALDRADGDLDAVGKIFNDLRFEDVRALQDMQMVTPPSLPRIQNRDNGEFCELDSGLQGLHGAVLQKLAWIRWMGASVRARISEEAFAEAHAP